MNPYELAPIGYVRNAVVSPDEVPYNGAPSVLELLPEHRKATAGLVPGFVWVVTWLHLSQRRAARELGAETRGSFASRTPARLNPVALTAARLTDINGCRLSVDALDVSDGTPLLDVKPYVREFDCVFGPADPAWRRAPLPEQRLARHVRTIERFCGPLTPDLALAARVALAVDRDLDLPANSREISWDCACALTVAAGIQAVSGAPLGDARFTLAADQGLVSARAGDRRIQYRLLDPKLVGEQILISDEAALFARA